MLYLNILFPKEALCTVLIADNLIHFVQCIVEVVVPRTQKHYFHARLLPKKFQGKSNHRYVYDW